jgi:hypothetical protein
LTQKNTTFKKTQLHQLFPIRSALRSELTWVKYSVLSDSQQIFASKYVLYLPTEMELKEERERHLAELRMKNEKQE